MVPRDAASIRRKHSGSLDAPPPLRRHCLLLKYSCPACVEHPPPGHLVCLLQYLPRKQPHTSHPGRGLLGGTSAACASRSFPGAPPTFVGAMGVGLLSGRTATLERPKPETVTITSLFGSHLPSTNPGETCSNGVPGIENVGSGVCCALGCDGKVRSSSKG